MSAVFGPLQWGRPRSRAEYGIIQFSDGMDPEGELGYSADEGQTEHGYNEDEDDESLFGTSPTTSPPKKAEKARWVDWCVRACVCA